MHIERLELKNYAGFADFTLEFPTGNLCVLIGENGSGKTSILEAIQMLTYAHLTSYQYKSDFWKSKQKKDTDIKTSAIFIEINNGSNATFSWGLSGLYVSEYYYDNEQNNEYLRLDSQEYWRKVYPLYQGLKNAKKKLLTEISMPNIQTRRNVFDEPKEVIPIYDIDTFVKWYKDLVLYDVYMIKKYKVDYSPKEAVEKAIMAFSGIKIDTQIGNSITDLAVFFIKNEITLNFEQLSQGEQKTINIIGQIVDAFAPPLKEDTGDILAFPGIVLIDEIETHLHPKWQREILPNLTKTFPNVQFIVSTHSPQIISSVPKEAIFLLKDFQAFAVQSATQGRDTNALLREVFGIQERPLEDMKMLGDFYEAVEAENVQNAEKLLQEMAAKWGSLDEEVVRATLYFEDLLNERV